MNGLPLNALRAFAAVYSQHGIRAAARELGVAHSSISRHLAELETWCGVPLVDSGTGRRGLAFTAQGEALGKAAVAALRDLGSAAMALRESRSIHAVMLSTTPSVAARWLLPRLPAFEETYPGIALSVQINQKVDDLEAGGIDIAIRMGRGPWPDGECEAFMDDRLYPVMSPALHERTGRPQQPDDLRRLRLLHDRDPLAGWECWRARFGPQSLDVLEGPRFASSDLVLRAAMQGQGVALARHRLASEDVVAGALLRPFGDLAVDLGPAYWIVLPGRARRRAAVQGVIDWLRRQGSAVQAWEPV
jgi:LysR family glycine cleavage system transcriptional activator